MHQTELPGSLNRRHILGVAAGTLAASQFGMSIPANAQARQSAATDLSDGRQMPPLADAIGWINTAPLTSEDLRGKIVLVQFWKAQDRQITTPPRPQRPS